MTMTIEPCKLSTAKAFLQALHPTGEGWGAQPGKWLFRGHADARWALLPTAFRPEAWEPFGGFDPSVNDDERTAHELSMLRWFAEHLNDAGLSVPGLGLLELHDIDPQSPMGLWPHALVELGALAQHHGIPTRLLDFTRQAYVAAYFAAQPPKDAPSDASHLGVWAVDSQWLTKYGPECEDNLWLSVEHALRASNPNLHAQSGLFITWMGNTRLTPLSALIAGINRGVYNPPFRSVDCDTSPIRFFTLPRSEAPDVLGLLVHEGISAARLFPGVDGVVRQIRDQVAHRVYDAGLGAISPPWDRSKQ